VAEKLTKRTVDRLIADADPDRGMLVWDAAVPGLFPGRDADAGELLRGGRLGGPGIRGQAPPGARPRRQAKHSQWRELLNRERQHQVSYLV
jgi:hypothetical protein